jgi:hypothetical protein
MLTLGLTRGVLAAAALLPESLRPLSTDRDGDSGLCVATAAEGLVGVWFSLLVGSAASSRFLLGMW